MTTLLNLVPYSINNNGEIAGAAVDNSYRNEHAATYQNGQLTDLSSAVGGPYGFSQAVAVNQQGDLLITVWTPNVSTQSFLYHASNGAVTNISGLPGGSGMIAAALNNSDQAVGNGFLYNNGSIQSLLSLLPAGIGWSNLNATGSTTRARSSARALTTGNRSPS